jgi:exonuclease SbcC
MPILPEKIEIQGFFAFRKPQVIEFEPLWKSGGLWGILGPNGAGKSSILEAILLALYHDSPRKTNEAEITTRGFSGEKYIRFYFKYEGQSYVCAFPRKEIEKIQKRLPPHYTILEPKKVKDLLKLSYEDFTLTVVLPQGQFADLLEATLSEQSRILSNFLPDKPWESIIEKVKKVESHLKDQVKSLETHIQFLEKQLEALHGATPEKRTELTAQIQSLETQRTSTESQLQELRMQLSRAQERDELQKRFQHLSQQYDSLLSRKQALEKLNHPTITQHLQEVNRLTQLLNKNREELKQQEDSLKKAEENQQKYVADLEKLAQEYNKVEPLYKNQAELTKLKSLCQEYQKVRQSLEDEIKNIAARLEEVQTPGLGLSKEPTQFWLEFVKEKLKKGDELWEELRNAEEKLTSLLEEAREKRERLRVDEALSQYVKALRPGEPCPLCGSTHHPHPRPIPTDPSQELRSVEAQIKTLEKDKSQLTKLQGLKESVSRVLNDHAQKEAEVSQLGKVLSERIGRETVSTFLRASDPKSLFQKAEEIQKKMEHLRQEISKLQGNKETITQNITKLEKEVETASQQLQELQDQLLQEIPKENPYYREFWQIADKQDISKAIQWSRQTLDNTNKELQEYEELRKRLEDPTSPYRNLPPTPQLQAHIQNLQNQLHDLQKEITRLSEEKGKLETDLKRKTELTTEIEQTKNTFDTLSNELKVISRVEKAIQGGELERYFVRHILLKPLIEEANRHLRDWLGGTLELRMPEKTDPGQSSKGEILQIQDLQSGGSEPRAVKTLSGGEKFLVSLALALALSDRIMRLKTKQTKTPQSFFFIDEGFDTLSTENFGFVMRTLQRLASQGRYIGLISHKVEAKEFLSAYLEVQKKNGATQVSLKTPFH